MTDRREQFEQLRTAVEEQHSQQMVALYLLFPEFESERVAEIVNENIKRRTGKRTRRAGRKPGRVAGSLKAAGPRAGRPPVMVECHDCKTLIKKKEAMVTENDSGTVELYCTKCAGPE